MARLGLAGRARQGEARLVVAGKAGRAKARKGRDRQANLCGKSGNRNETPFLFNGVSPDLPFYEWLIGKVGEAWHGQARQGADWRKIKCMKSERQDV